MQAWELQEGGVLTLVERAAPQAEPEHIVVRMRAASLNYRDVLVARNTYGVPLRLPLIPLSDGAGEVVEVGASVRQVQVGDRVAGAFMPAWIEGAFSPEKAASALGGGNVDGVLAELVVLPEQGVVRVPEHLTFEEAATLPCAGVTAWYALFEGGSLKAGQTVLLLGTGGVSLFALQFAKLVGARVIITSSSDAKLTRAAQLGADETINYKTVPDWGKRVQELTGGRGADVVVEVGGPDTINQSLEAVCFGGHISLMGVLTGLAAPVNTGMMLHKQVRVQGTYVGSRMMFEAMNRAITQAKLRPTIDKIFAFDQATDALVYLEQGAHFGKVCIRINDEELQ